MSTSLSTGRLLRLAAPISTAALLHLIPSLSPALASDAFHCTVNSPSSTVTYTVSSAVPFTGSLIGAGTSAPVGAEQTRTKRMANIFQCGTFGATQNDAIVISGSLSASGMSPTPTNVHPGGSFILGYDPVANTSGVQNLNLNLLAQGSLTAAASLTGFTYQSFCTVAPACNAPFIIPLTFPLGSVNVTVLTAVQDPGLAAGTLTPTGANTWDFSITVPVTISGTASLNGAPIPIDPQPVAILYTGSITRSGNTINVSSATTITLTRDPMAPPTPLPATPFTIPTDSPLCPNINIILTLTLDAGPFTAANTAALVSSGTKIPCKCDVNASGTVSVEDVFQFLALWFANDPRADFNGIGGIGIQDIFDFLACFFSPPFGC